MCMLPRFCSISLSLNGATPTTLVDTADALALLLRGTGTALTDMDVDS